MGNCVGRRRQALKLTKKPELAWKHILSRRGCLHCGRYGDEDWSCPKLGSCSCSQNALSLSSCVFFSPRIQGLFEGYKTKLETTQEHWTQVGFENDAEMERVGEDNRKYFNEVLMKHRDWSDFFSKFEGLIVNDKIGEGGQAEIFGARMKYGIYKDESLVAKIFKKNVSLRDLERQWPIELLSEVKRKEFHFGSPINMVFGGAFIRDGIHKNRFAFVMERRMCDLRAVLDQRMLNLLHKRTHRPPFSSLWTITGLLQRISGHMLELHEHGVVHRDIKASNVLLDAYEYGNFFCLMDFECALGTIGTGFWRAPEILEQVQMRVPCHEVVFTKQADIYSFGMMCYEIITGCIPFDGQPQNDYSIVLGGGRPKLPCNLDPILRGLILDCWKQNPQERPTAREIVTTLESRFVESSGITFPYSIKTKNYDLYSSRAFCNMGQRQ